MCTDAHHSSQMVLLVAKIAINTKISARLTVQVGRLGQIHRRTEEQKMDSDADAPMGTLAIRGGYVQSEC